MENMSENFANISEIRDLRTAFDLLDRDQDGMVTPTELQFMLRNLGIHVSDELIDGLMKEASKTGNGLIDETEFLQWIGRIQALREESTPSADDDDLTQDLVAAFRVFDRDNNGYITRDELQRAMQMIGENVTEGQLNDMLALADLDKDGRINYEEFARLLLNNELQCLNVKE
ncbi:hypothetical protein PVAND_010357 [Polypedilum vanderplanki]|uniref:EF-hand domain-containing protein n=1 Tax=Polypedilum vanderplanki TaxID=319348 RepID=A0A9J6CFN4_POLVA|nr:hypothetical protein PVAND_010357 [Polypedilum vanderplanki]